jgi:hypothetical protein
MADDTVQTGALPTADDATLRYGTKGNLSLAGQKGVSLEAPQSADIRQRLMQMIAERERGNPMQEALGNLALATSEQSGIARNYNDYLTRKRQQEQELFGMHVSLGQLASEEARLKREAEEQQRIAQIFGLVPQAPAPAGGGVYPTQGANALTSAEPTAGGLGLNMPTAQGPGMEGQPGGGLSAVRPQTAFAGGQSPQMTNLINSLIPEERMSLYGLGRDPKTRPDMYKELLKRAAPTETERLAAAAGLTPGTPEHSAFMRAKIAGSGAFVPHDVRGAAGTMQQTPMEAITGGLRPAAPTAPVAVPAAPAAPAVAAPAAPAAAAPRSAAPTAVPMATGFAPGSAEDLAIRKRQQEIQQDIIKEGAIEETKKIAIPEQTALSDAVKQAPTNLILSQSLVNDVKAHPDLFGKLMQPTIWSSAANLLDTGVQIGQFGSISIPGIKDFVQQLDPAAAKDPKKLEAWTRIISNMAKVKLGYAQSVLKGQGAVSDNERRLIDTAVGDPSRDSAQNMLMKAKAIEIEARNATEQNKLWEKSRDKMNWAQFKASSQYKEMQRAQFYRTAKVFKIENAKWPGDE